MATPAHADGPEFLHRVTYGENVTTIAGAYGVGVDVLVRTNQLSEPSLIRPGQTLVIPIPSADGSPTSKVQSPESPTSKVQRPEPAPTPVEGSSVRSAASPGSRVPRFQGSQAPMPAPSPSTEPVLSRAEALGVNAFGGLTACPEPCRRDQSPASPGSQVPEFQSSGGQALSFMPEQWLNLIRRASSLIPPTSGLVLMEWLHRIVVLLSQDGLLGDLCTAAIPAWLVLYVRWGGRTRLKGAPTPGHAPAPAPFRRNPPGRGVPPSQIPTAATFAPEAGGAAAGAPHGSEVSEESRRLGDFLLANGLLTTDGLEAARAQAAQSGTSLDAILESSGSVTAEQLERARFYMEQAPAMARRRAELLSRQARRAARPAQVAHAFAAFALLVVMVAWLAAGTPIVSSWRPL